MVEVKLAHVDENVAAAQLDRIAFHASVGLLSELASREVILPAMPGATYNGAFKITFAQRASVMEAYTIDSKQFTVDVGDGDSFAGYVKFADLTRRYLLLSCCALKRHAEPPCSEDRGV